MGRTRGMVGLEAGAPRRGLTLGAAAGNGVVRKRVPWKTAISVGANCRRCRRR
jgi:hypothetical protein